MHECQFSRQPSPAMENAPHGRNIRGTGGAVKLRRQWSDHLEQSAACTTSTRAVTEHLHTCTEETTVLNRPTLLRRFYAILVPNENAPTYLHTYLQVCTRLRQGCYHITDTVCNILIEVR